MVHQQIPLMLKTPVSEKGLHQLGLHDSMTALEQAVSPLSNCGLTELRDCLHAVEVSLHPSCQDSLCDVTNGVAPRLEHAVEQLIEEETRLRCTLLELIEKTRCQNLAVMNNEIREAVRHWIERYQRYCSRKVDLVQDAWNQDLGTGD